MNLYSLRTAALLLAAAATALGAAAQARQKDEASPAAAADPASRPVAKETAARLDLNSASETELATLPGINAAKAKLIAKNRPYDDTDMLVQLKVLTNKEYQAIKNLVTTAPAAGKR
jgi:competence protein ComEA